MSEKICLSCKKSGTMTVSYPTDKGDVYFCQTCFPCDTVNMLGRYNAPEIINQIFSSHGCDLREKGIDPTFGQPDHCFYCKKESADLKRCNRCKTAKYCSVDCQRKDWSVHKGLCK